jgi:hypothetical protein
MKTKTLISILIAFIAILVSSCNNSSWREVLAKDNKNNIAKNYPYLYELNGFALIDSAFNRVYTVTDCSDLYSRTYEPELCGVIIEVEEWSSKSRDAISFNDNLYDGSLDKISTYDLKDVLSLDWNMLPYNKSLKLESNKDNFPALLKDNQGKFDCIRKRISELAAVIIKKEHEEQAIRDSRAMQKLQDAITTLVPCER